MELNVNHQKEKATCFAICAFAIQPKDELSCRIHYNFLMANGKNYLHV